jgi:O-antigen/teichoic acid export membrane protein
VTTHAPAEQSRLPTTPLQSGARSGAILAGASGVSIVAAYVFLLAAGRILGSEDYGALAALLGLLAIVLIPAGALQMAVSREVARRLAAGDSDGAAGLSRAVLRLSLIATVPLVVVALALSAPLADLLQIDSVGLVALANLTLVTALVFPVALGVLQGMQRFTSLATLYVFPWLVRVVVLAIAAAAGFRLGGALFATLAGAIGATVLALALAREPLSRHVSVSRAELSAFLRYLGPVAAGLVGIALLTHVDLLIVKARFSADDAGAYAAASAFARVAFFLPTTILTVLFPRTAARQARGEETEDILGRSLLATAAFCGLLALVYAASGVGIVSTTFGPDFREGGAILGPFALAIGLFSLANILVGYHLSRGESRYAWIVGAGVVVQVTLLATVPTTLRQFVWTNVLIGVGLLAAHEVAVGSSVPAIRAGWSHVRGATARLRPVLPEAALVLAGTTAFVCALFWPLVAHLSSTIAGNQGSDATGSVAWFWRAQHESGFHLLGVTHHTLTGAPFGWDQSNALNIQIALAYYPTYLATHVVGAIAAYNLTTLAGYVLSGATMYLLVRYLGCSRLVAAWAALVYVVFPWHLARIEHASLLHIEVLALLVLSLLAAVRKPTWLRFGIVAAANLACWLMSGYFGPMAAITTVAFAIGAALTTGRWRRSGVLVAASVGAALVTPALFAIAAVVSGTNAGAGLDRVAGDLSVFGLYPRELVIPAARNLLFAGDVDSYWAAHRHGSNQTETTNYLGLLTIALALGWIVFAIRHRKAMSERAALATGGLGLAFVVGLGFASPSPVHVFGHALWTPSRLLWEVVPAFRVPSRWDALLMTALVPIAALGLQRLGQAAAGRWHRGWIFPAIVGAAMVVSFLELSIRPAEARFRTALPPEYAAVERTPPGILAEYPMGYSDIYALWQTRHHRPIFTGAPPETPADYARLAVIDPSQAGTAPALALLGVTAIAIHPFAHVDTEVAPQEPKPGSGFELVGRFPQQTSVWRVVAQPAGAFVTLPGGFAKPRFRDAAGFVAYPMIGSGGVGVLQLAAKAPGVVQLTFDALPAGGRTQNLRVTDSKTEQAFTLKGKTPVSVLVEVPRGLSQLLLKTDPPATSEDDAIVISAPRAAKASGQAALHADLVSPDPGF